MRLLEAAEPLVLAKGFHAVGINEVLEAVSVPKGSFYHHFASKEEFGAALLKQYVSESVEYKIEGLKQSRGESSTARDRIISFLEQMRDEFVKGGCDCPCLVLKLTAEVATYSEVMREEVKRCFESWVSIYKNALSQAVEEGSLIKSTDVEGEARLLLDYWYGAVQRAIAKKSSDPLDRALSFLKNRYFDTLAA